MIPRNCKRLAEVGFPIAEVSRQAVREKSIRRGHPSTLHLWWARRPLASSRAILMALLLPDPCDAQCPKTFKEEARHILLSMYGRPRGEASPIERDEGLRRMMLKFIADFANWDNAAKPRYLKTGQALVRAAHPDQAPPRGGPFRRRRLHPAGGVAPRLRGVCQRPQSRCLSHSQGHAGGCPAPRAGAGGWFAARGRRDQEKQQRRNWSTCIRPTRMAPRQSPVSGLARCAAKHGAAARRFPSYGRCGSRSAPIGSGLCTPSSLAPRGRHHASSSRCSSHSATTRYGAARSRGARRAASVAARYYHRNGCEHSSLRNEAARTWYSTMTAHVSAAR